MPAWHFWNAVHPWDKGDWEFACCRLQSWLLAAISCGSNGLLLHLLLSCCPQRKRKVGPAARQSGQDTTAAAKKEE